MADQGARHRSARDWDRERRTPLSPQQVEPNEPVIEGFVDPRRELRGKRNRRRRRRLFGRMINFAEAEIVCGEAPGSPESGFGELLAYQDLLTVEPQNSDDKALDKGVDSYDDVDLDGESRSITYI